MGCDYVVINGLQIDYKDGSVSDFIELERIKTYFDDRLELDYNSDYESMSSFLEDTYLKVKYKSVVLFEDGIWIKNEYKEKYKEKIFEKYVNVSNIDKIIKKQKRY